MEQTQVKCIITKRRKVDFSRWRVQLSLGPASEFVTLDQEGIDSIRKFFYDAGFEIVYVGDQ